MKAILIILAMVVAGFILYFFMTEVFPYPDTEPLRGFAAVDEWYFSHRPQFWGCVFVLLMIFGIIYDIIEKRRRDL